MRIETRLVLTAIDFVVIFAMLRSLEVGMPASFAVAAVSAVTMLGALWLAPRTTSEGLERHWWVFLWAGLLGLLFGTWLNEWVRSYPALAVASMVLSLVMIGYGLHFRSLGRKVRR